MSVSSTYDRVCESAYAAARRRIAPGLRNSQYEYAAALSERLRTHGRWLDLGCGHDFLPTWMAPDARNVDTSRWQAIGIDMDRSSIRRHHGLDGRVVGNIERLPFRENRFDLITANMVVEHVQAPGLLFREIARVLRPGGSVIIHTPNESGYTTRLTQLIPERMLAPAAALLLGRAPEDVYPTFYRANSKPTLERFAGESGLVLDRFRFVDSSPQLIRIPPLMLAELALIRTLDRPALQSRRACILATMTKPAAGQSQVNG